MDGVCAWGVCTGVTLGKVSKLFTEGAGPSLRQEWVFEEDVVVGYGLARGGVDDWGAEMFKI